MAPPIELRAGSLSVTLVDGELRYARIAGREVLRRLAVVVRDAGWGTVAPALDPPGVRQDGGGFTVELAARCAQGGIDVRWRATLRADADGALDGSLHVEPAGAFAYNRIGFVLLHPPREVTGRPYRGAGPGGALEGELPRHVAPQRVVDGLPTPIFPSFASLALDQAGGVRARFDFEGDLFEMEDQRNWTDGSFKTYSTPLGAGFPHHAVPGRPIRQRVRMQAELVPAGSRIRRRPELAPRPRGVQGRVPALGTALGEPGPGTGTALVRGGAHHVRVDLGPDDDWPARLADASDSSLPIELALTVAGGRLPDLTAPRGRARLARVLVFEAGTACTPPGLVERVAAELPGVPVCGGTDGHFADLNRDRPAPDAWAGVGVPASPQAHLRDDDTLRESLEALPDVLGSLCALYPGLPVHVSPVTLRPRRGPGADPGDALGTGADVRLETPFGAAWTLGCLAALAAGGAATVTAFRAAGQGGLAGRDGRPRPALAAFAAVAALAGAPLRRVAGTDPLRLAALAADLPSKPVLLLANLTAEPLDVRSPWDAGASLTAIAGPGAAATGARLELAPYAVVKLAGPRTSTPAG